MIRVGDERWSATFDERHGMLGTSITHEGAELLALPYSLDAYCAGKLTGLPLMHPWANRLASDAYGVGDTTVQLPSDLPRDANGFAMHGTMHGRPFSLVEAAADYALTRYEFAEPEQLESFPFPHILDVFVQVNVDPCTLTVRTSIDNTGANAMPIAFGWHPYFRVPGAPRDEWRLRIPSCTRHELDSRCLPTGAVCGFDAIDRPVGTTRYDDHFSLGTDRHFEISTQAKTIAIDFDDAFAYCQIYLPEARPGVDPFICIEPMTATVNALGAGTAALVQPGGRFEATFTISVW